VRDDRSGLSQPRSSALFANTRTCLRVELLHSWLVAVPRTRLATLPTKDVPPLRLGHRSAGDTRARLPQETVVRVGSSWCTLVGRGARRNSPLSISASGARFRMENPPLFGPRSELALWY
jgi:hypothetical protein